MTKFILHGGETGIPNNHNKAFYQEWVKDFKPDFTPTILLVYFSRPTEEWEKLRNQDEERFARHTNNRLTRFVVASENLELFQEEVKNADVIYIRGGSTEKLMETLAPVKDKLLDILKDKVCAGSSAGAMMFAHFAGSSTTDWEEGFGLLPFNTIVHWSEALQEYLNTFKKSHPESGYEYVLLPETEFVVRIY